MMLWSSGLLLSSLVHIDKPPPCSQVTGTLRDQLLYPFPPRGVWTSASVEERWVGLVEHLSVHASHATNLVSCSKSPLTQLPAHEPPTIAGGTTAHRHTCQL